MVDRIKIGDIWYVREDTITQDKIKLEPFYSDSWLVENDEVSFEANRIYKSDGTLYDEPLAILYTNKKTKNEDCWDNKVWLEDILKEDKKALKELDTLSKDNQEFFKAFLLFLREKEWL